MSKYLSLLFVAIACFPLACGFATPEPTPAPPTPVPTLPPGAVVVESPMKNFRIETLEIKVGTMVIWTNKGTVLHTISHIPKEVGVAVEFDSGTIPPVGSFRHYFTKPGVYPYNCLIHPVAEFGTITVTE